jgi:NAD(P)-dependent dehydrogenase (short-subunit alcohol dehydrogenase family)
MTVSSRFTGKVAIVTGAASGIGAAITRQLVDEGAHVIGLDISTNGLKVIESELGDSFFGLVTDVTDENDVAAAVATSVERFGALDVAFNVAGAARAAPLVDLIESDWDFTVNIILKSIYLCTKHEARNMLSSGRSGAIVNTSSINAHMPLFSGSAYAAAKAGVEMFTKNAALELGCNGIRVNAILPGLVHTQLTEWAILNDDLRQDFLDRIPLHRVAVPADIAGPSLYLASEDASYITGSSLVVDGGWELTGYPDLSRYV